MRCAHNGSFLRTLRVYSDAQRQCTYYFPETFANGSLPVPNVAETNSAFDGWNVHIDRLFFANGKRTSHL